MTAPIYVREVGTQSPWHRTRSTLHASRIVDTICGTKILANGLVASLPIPDGWGSVFCAECAREEADRG